MNQVFMVILSISAWTKCYVQQTSSDVPEWTNLLYGYTSHHCYDIPDSFTMCKNIGYEKMILPNFLQHETVIDAANSSRDWQRLIEFNCHNDSRRFLCSLYAPVCVPNERVTKIHPCQELCLSVKKACSPSMMTFGYKWPDILHCDKFPQKNVGLCIRGTDSKSPTNLGIKVNELTNTNSNGCNCASFFDTTNIDQRYCSSRIALKAKIAQIVSTKELQVVLRLHHKSSIIKATRPDIPRLSMVIIPCPCNQIKHMNLRKGRWLIMGDVRDGQFTLTSLIKWRKKNKDFKQTIRRFKKFESKVCGTQYQVTHKDLVGLNIFGEKMKGKKEKKIRRKNNLL